MTEPKDINYEHLTFSIHLAVDKNSQKMQTEYIELLLCLKDITYTKSNGIFGYLN